MPTLMSSFWDQRYAGPGYLYGQEPNDFLRAFADRLPPGPVLSLADGEGRNGVFLAERGHAVTAVDGSAVGLEKARALARARGVALATVHADLADYAVEPGAFTGIVSIFCHLPPELRRKVHAAAVRGLRPGGVLLLEAYRPQQLELRTGGPDDPSLLYSLDELRQDFAGLELLHAAELLREIHEGPKHDGPGAVVQLVGQKPGSTAP